MNTNARSIDLASCKGPATPPLSLSPRQIAERIDPHGGRQFLVQSGVPILMYHKVAWPLNPLAYKDIQLYVSPRLFLHQLKELFAARVDSLSLGDLDLEEANRRPSVILSFDDGYACTFRNAIEPVTGYGFRAIMYLVAGGIGKYNEWDAGTGVSKERLMDKAQVRDWLAAGHEIGSHTVRHCSLTNLSDERTHEEIASSKKILEDTFGVQVRHFCYPYGDHDERTRDVVLESGYETAVTTARGTNTAATDKMSLNRLFVRHERVDLATWISLLMRRV